MVAYMGDVLILEVIVKLLMEKACVEHVQVTFDLLVIHVSTYELHTYNRILINDIALYPGSRFIYV